MDDPQETLVPFTYGDFTVIVSSYDALMLSSDLFLLGNAYVVEDGHRHRRVPPGGVTPTGQSVRRIEKG